MDNRSLKIFNKQANDPFAWYKGNQLFCYEGLLLWIGLLPLLYLLVKALESFPLMGILIFFVLVVILFIPLSFRLYYFGLSANYLVIRLHNISRYRKVYPVTTIKEVILERRRNMPVSMRVITRDDKSKVFPAASLSPKIWQQLKAELEKRNVLVHNRAF